MPECYNMVLKINQRASVGVANERLVEDTGIAVLEVKFKEHRRTTRCESGHPSHLCQSGTKVGGSKMIRYRRSPNRKLYRQEIGR